MTRTPKPIIHGRDHEHGGADPTRIVYETVGTGGGGGGGGVTAVDLYGAMYGGTAATVVSGATGNMIWSFTSGTPLLDLTVDTSPKALFTGLYTVTTKILLLNFPTALEFVQTLEVGLAAVSQLWVPVTGITTVRQALTVSYPVAAGDTIALVVNNRAGSSQDFQIQEAAVSAVVVT